MISLNIAGCGKHYKAPPATTIISWMSGLFAQTITFPFKMPEFGSTTMKDLTKNKKRNILFKPIQPLFGFV